MGTPEFAVPTLRRLTDVHDVVAVFCQPDRPAGRGRLLRRPPVARLADEFGIPVLQPASLRRGADAAAAIRRLRELSPDILVVAAYGLLLPRAVLEAAPYGAVNVHASLLPRWRGAAPIQHAIIEGDAQTGVTVMLMDEGLDTGAMLARKAMSIGRREGAEQLAERLAAVGAELLVATLPPWLEGELEPVLQPESGATYAPRLRREDGLIDWRLPAARLERRVRGLQPWPGAHTLLPDGTRLKVLVADQVDGTDAGPDAASGPGVAPSTSADPGIPSTADDAAATVDATVPGNARENLEGDAAGRPATLERGVGKGAPAPGTVFQAGGIPAVQTGEGHLLLIEVQPAGRRAMSGADLLRGWPGLLGARLGLAAAPEAAR